MEHQQRQDQGEPDAADKLWLEIRTLRSKHEHLLDELRAQRDLTTEIATVAEQLKEKLELLSDIMRPFTAPVTQETQAQPELPKPPAAKVVRMTMEQRLAGRKLSQFSMTVLRGIEAIGTPVDSYQLAKKLGIRSKKQRQKVYDLLRSEASAPNGALSRNKGGLYEPRPYVAP